MNLLAVLTSSSRRSPVPLCLMRFRPAVCCSSFAQINILFDSLLASFLVTGSISWLYYSDRLIEFPLGVFGIALATVILPNLSREYAADSTQGFSAMLEWALRLVLISRTALPLTPIA